MHRLKPGVKINGTYYHDIVFLLPDIHAASGSEFFSSVPSHHAIETVALLDQETPDFIAPALWPPIPELG